MSHPLLTPLQTSPLYCSCPYPPIPKPPTRRFRLQLWPTFTLSWQMPLPVTVMTVSTPLYPPPFPVYLHHIPQYVRIIQYRCMMQLISNQNHESKLMHGAIEKIVRTDLLFLTKNWTLHYDKDVTCFSVWMISWFDYTPPPLTLIFTSPSLPICTPLPPLNC